MAEFAYNNTKNASIDHISFELNYGYHFKILFKEDIDLCLRSYSANKLAEELKELIESLLSKPILCIRAAKKSSR